jgi:hypothetical protein
LLGAKPGASGLHKSRHFTVTLFLSFLASGLLAHRDVRAVDDFAGQVKPILTKYCTTCHDAVTSKADLRIDLLIENFGGSQSETWHDVLNRIEVGEMPPQDATQLPTPERRRLVAWIRNGLNAFEQKKGQRDQGVVRRLTRYEYNNTVRDLTGIDLDYAIDLPPDSNSVNGFKNNGMSLGLSAIQMEYYVLAARRAMSRAIVNGPAPKVFRHRFETSSSSNAPKIKTPIGNRMQPGGRFFGKMLEFPREGEFVVRIKAGALVPEGEGIPRMRISIGLRSDTVSPTKILGEVDVTNSERSPKVYEFRGRIDEFPLPGHNPKFPGITIVVSNVYDDGLPPELPLSYPRVQFSREESKEINSRVKKNKLIIPDSESFAKGSKRIADIIKSAEAYQKKIEELRSVNASSDSQIDVACRLYEADETKAKLYSQLRKMTQATKVDFKMAMLEFENANAARIEDQIAVLARFSHLTPLNPKDKEAIRERLPAESPRSTLVLESLEFEGPLFEQWPPKAHQILLPAAPANQASFKATDADGLASLERTRAILAIKRFMKRAFRRPIDDSDLEYVLSFYDEVRRSSETFEEAVREAFVMILVSPEFLFQFEPNRSSVPRALSTHELATRVSYFLWSSTPDAELTELADAGDLSDPAVLEKQVRRMLESTRSSEFVQHFTDQWLDLKGVERVAINPEYYPHFKDSLKDAMRRETQAFFGEILRNDLSALNLLDSRFVMLNEPLAKHYQLDGPKGGAFERIELPEGSKRGGLLTQASILLLNSTGEDSHPIRRAVWLRSRLLDDAPAPPPPDVPELDSDSAELSSLSVREQLEHHRTREACNDCHRGLDPWGIPFEHFDATGNYRLNAVRLAAKKKRKMSVPVSSKSVLPNGTEIQDLNGLKSYLMNNEKRRFARTLVARLLEYGTGRGVGFSDRNTVEQLTDRFEKADYRLSDLIIAIVQSENFQSK